MEYGQDVQDLLDKLAEPNLPKNQRIILAAEVEELFITKKLHVPGERARDTAEKLTGVTASLVRRYRELKLKAPAHIYESFISGDLALTRALADAKEGGIRKCKSCEVEKDASKFRPRARICMECAKDTKRRAKAKVEVAEKSTKAGEAEVKVEVAEKSTKAREVKPKKKLGRPPDPEMVKLDKIVENYKRKPKKGVREKADKVLDGLNYHLTVYMEELSELWPKLTLDERGAVKNELAEKGFMLVDFINKI